MSAEVTYTPSFTGGHCLSTVALRQYIDGTLPKKSLHLVERHLLDCDFCSTVLDDMDVTDSAVSSIDTITRNVNARISDIIGAAPKPLFWSEYGAYLKTGAVILTLLAGYLIYSYSNKDSIAASSAPALVIPPLHRESDAPAVSEPREPSVQGHNELASNKTTASQELKQDNHLSEVNRTEPIPTDNKVELTNAEVADEQKQKPEALAIMPSQKPVAAIEPPAEKENFSDLQIVNAKVLQKMSKTAGSTRKSSKNGQLPTPNTRKSSYYLLEDMPEYPGGDLAMEDYLTNHFRNPVKDKRLLTGPAVGVMFTVSSGGKISEVEITRSVGLELDVEIIRLISSMPQWNPGKHKGDITCVMALTVH
jgi:hypothetical protein